MATDKDWQRLADLVSERRADLGMTQEDVRAAGGPSTATQRLIEGALQSRYQPVILGRLETALKWERGSVRRILAGRDPVAVDSEPEPVTATASVTPTPMAADTDADAMESAVVTAALPRREREVWAEMRASLQRTHAGRELFSDLAERALWPEGGAPIELTEQAGRVLDATPPEALFTARSDILAASMVMYPWHERVRWAAAGRAVLRRPTVAVRRAG
jgi:hypothetical protein